MSPQIPELLELLKAGVHFGHKTSRWHPKMAPFIFGERSGVHIIDLEKTQIQLKGALAFATELGRQGKTMLFVGTKKQAAPIIRQYAKEAGVPYVDNRWLGGTLTNWKEIYKVIKSYVELKSKQEGGELAKKYTKREQVNFAKEIERMGQLVGGASTLTAPPNALFIVDIKHEDTAVREAKQKNIPVIALCDTNTNPEGIAYPIAGNDDAVKAIEMVVRLVAEAYNEGKAERAIAVEAEIKKEEEKVEEAVTLISNSPKV